MVRSKPYFFTLIARTVLRPGAILYLLCAVIGVAHGQDIINTYSKRAIRFNHPNGPYANKLLLSDFGNGSFPSGRDFAAIENGVYKITFNKGQKVQNTGAAVQLNIPPALQYTLEYRIKYDANFQQGLHGKQFGFVIGVGYDGGRGEQARANGNGGSVRLQFDSRDSMMSNQLYVYHAAMQGKYGENPGKQNFAFKKGEWNTIKMTVTMQSHHTEADGKIEVWCNGIKMIDVNNMLFVRDELSRKITRLSFESFPGGGGDIPLYDNYVYVDDVKWYTGNTESRSTSLPGSVFRNSSVPVEERINDLLSKLTIEEKIGLLGYDAKAVNRLDIPKYNWWNEALHGVARAGKATVFPQAIAMAATFNDGLVQQIADAISTEARAKYNEAVRRNSRIQYMGLTYWSPNINIFRDPRWGRGQETYGEDPFLTATMGVAFVKGLQGNHPKYLKVAACAKHFAVHSGPEATRHSFNAVVDQKDLRETYLYAFDKLVKAKVEAVMCAYNRLNDQACCSSESLLTNILRKEWGFNGHVVSDCWALDDIFKGHKILDNPVAVAAAAIKAGLNLDCSELLQNNVGKAIQQGFLTEKDIDKALEATLRTQIKLGMFDAPAQNPFHKLNASNVHTPAHIALARTAAQQSMVLLKNENNVLPLDKKKYKSMMVIGPNAASVPALVANYNGLSGNLVTFAEGITEAAGAGVAVQYDEGSNYFDTTRFGGVWAAGNCDVTIAVIGLTPLLEGEEHDAFLSLSGGDKATLSLPAPHIKLLQQLKKNNKPLVVVVNAGSNVDMQAIEPYADAILLAWYPGEQGGTALADILFGTVSPSGRLPVTFYKSLNDVPAYDDYAMKGRTYRYYDGPVQYPFGYGLSYTRFQYSWKKKPAGTLAGNYTLHFSVDITNTGKMKGDEVVQVYVQYPSFERMPMKELKAFKRVSVDRMGKKTVSFSIPVGELKKWNMETGGWTLYPGEYKIAIGPDAQNFTLSSTFKLTQ